MLGKFLCTVLGRMLKICNVRLSYVCSFSPRTWEILGLMTSKFLDKKKVCIYIHTHTKSNLWKIFQPSLLAFYSLLNPAFESKYHTHAPDTSSRHSQCLSLLVYKMSMLLLTQLKGVLGDLPAAWPSSTGRSPSARARQSAHTHPSSRRGAFAYAVPWDNGKYMGFLKSEDLLFF